MEALFRIDSLGRISPPGRRETCVQEGCAENLETQQCCVSTRDPDDYRFAVPRTIFFTLRFKEPRGAVRFAFAGAFLRAARFAFLRSSLLSDLVFAMSSNLMNFYCFIMQSYGSEMKSLTTIPATIIANPTQTSTRPVVNKLTLWELTATRPKMNPMMAAVSPPHRKTFLSVCLFTLSRVARTFLPASSVRTAEIVP